MKLSLETNPSNDPRTGMFLKDMAIMDLIDHYAIIINWLADPTTESLSLLECIKAHYSLYPWDNKDIVIGEDKSMTYPGDPVLYPLVAFERGPEKLYLYESDWALIQDGESWVFARID